MTLLSELRRRRVYHVAVGYAAAAFIAAQAADVFLPRLGLPDWTVTLVVMLAVAGFPVALVLGWTFDLTAQGVQRTGPAAEHPVDARPVAVPPPKRSGRVRIAGGTISAAALLAIGGWWLMSVPLQPASPAIDRMAVLPLINLTNDPDQQHFVDALHDAVIAELAQIQALTVVSRQSVIRYRGTDRPVPELAQELGVGAVVQGSVFRVGDSVRITASLLQAQPTERHLWTGTFQRDLGEVLRLQGEMARVIAELIEVAVTPNELSRLTRVRPVDPAAYQAWLRGWVAGDRGAGPGARECVAHAREAIAIDPGFAPAHALVASCQIKLTYVTPTPPDESFPQAKAAALRAIELDPSLADAHAALAWVLATYDWDWPAADRAFRRALELEPGAASIIANYGMFLSWMGRDDEAIALATRAQDLGPGLPGPRANLALLLYMARRYDEAIDQARLAVELAPDHGFAHDRLAWAYEGKGMFEESVTARETVVELLGEGRSGALARAYALAGRPDDALRVLDQLLRQERTGYVPPIQIAYAYQGLRQYNEAMAWLELGYATRDGHMPLLYAAPGFDSIRPLPRFQRLVERMGFPEP
jgi:TolB-like protein/Flp pilus assembly protein TadD